MTQAYRSTMGKNKIIITAHANQRFKDRYSIGGNKKDLKTLASRARYNGINLRYMTPQEVGDNELYRYLAKYFNFKNKSNVIRYLDGYVYIFGGHKSRTLLTVVNVPNSLVV